MTNIIQELAKQAGCSIDEMGYGEGNIEKFAELVIQECITEVAKHNPHPDQWSDMSEYTEKRTVLECIENIKKRFKYQNGRQCSEGNG